MRVGDGNGFGGSDAGRYVWMRGDVSRLIVSTVEELNILESPGCG